MFVRYAGSLLLVLVVVCGVLSRLPFAARSQVRAGAGVEETWVVDFTLRAADKHYYTIDDEVKAGLERGLKFFGSGPVRVRTVGVSVTPKEVAWRSNKTDFKAPGGQMVARVAWEAKAEAGDGEHGDVHIFFPKIAGVSPYTFVFHSGTHKKSADGHWMFREVTVRRTDAGVVAGRMLAALPPALPIAILLHAVWWCIWLARERRRRVEELTAAVGKGLPGVFYPSPAVEWLGWTVTLCVFAGMGALPAVIAICQEYEPAGIIGYILVTQAIGLLLAVAVAVGIRMSVITVRLDEREIAYARGRGEPAWVTARWEELRGATMRSMTGRGRTSVWLELGWPDGRKVRVPSTTIEFPLLRDLVMDRIRRRQ